MFSNNLLALGFLITSLILVIWYKFFYCTQKLLQNFISLGGIESNFKPNLYDDYAGLKQAVKDDPNLKFVARKLPGKIFLTFVDSDLIKDVITNHQYYAKLNKKFAIARMLTGKSIIMAEGPSWKLHRLLISEAFQYSFFNSMIPAIVRTTDKVLGISQKKETVIKLPDTFELITSDVATTTFFGIGSGDVEINGRKAPSELSDILMRVMAYGMSPIRFFPGFWILNLSSEYRNLKKRVRNFRKFFNDQIHKRIEELDARSKKEGLENITTSDFDVLGLLLHHRLKANHDPTQTLSDEEILDDFVVFSVAGKDTTSCLASMSLYCVVKYPEWGKKLIQEVESMITTPEAITLDLINSMPVMSAFLNEVLRMFPPAPVILPREALQDHYVGKIFVEKGTLVTASVIGSHFNPKYFDEPEKFNPTRWFKDEKCEEGWKSNPFAYVPFSGGSRNCIGKHFALIEARVIICSVLKSFNVSIDPGFELKMGYIGVGYMPKEAIPLKLTPK